MKERMKRNETEGGCRYLINSIAGRIDLACKTLDVRKLYAAHRVIFISGSVLDELQWCLERLPLSSQERLTADTIVYGKAYGNIPVFTDDIFKNPQLFSIVSDIFVMDTSFMLISPSCKTLHTTVSMGLNTVQISLHEPPDTGFTPGLHRTPHYCYSEHNIMELGRDSFLPWKKYSFSNENQAFADYKSQTTEIQNVFFNQIYECKYCSTQFLRCDTLSPSRLKTQYEQSIEVIENGR